MRKIALLLSIVIFGSAAFAAVPVGKLGFGVQGLTLTSRAITMPTLQLYFNENTAGEIGLAFANTSNGASVSNFTFALALKLGMLKPMGDIYPHWGIGLAYTSNPNMAPNSSNVALALNLGAQYFVTPNLSIEGNIVPLSINIASPAVGGSTTTISVFNSNVLPAAVVGAHLYI
jgi:hypothetical protein